MRAELIEARRLIAPFDRLRAQLEAPAGTMLVIRDHADVVWHQLTPLRMQGASHS